MLVNGSIDRKSQVRLLPESDGHAVCITLDGLVKGEDFDSVFLESLRDAHKKHGSFNIAMYFTNHIGWDEKAAALSFDGFYRYGQHAKRIAYISPPPGKIMHVKLFQSCIAAEIRVFPEEELAAALAWVKER